MRVGTASSASHGGYLPPHALKPQSTIAASVLPRALPQHERRTVIARPGFVGGDVVEERRAAIGNAPRLQEVADDALVVVVGDVEMHFLAVPRGRESGPRCPRWLRGTCRETKCLRDAARNPGAAMRHPLGGKRKSVIGRRPFQHSTQITVSAAAGEPCHTLPVTRRLRLALLLAALAVAGPMPPVRAVDAGRRDVSIAWFRSERIVQSAARSVQTPLFPDPVVARRGFNAHPAPLLAAALLSHSLFQRPPPLQN